MKTFDEVPVEKEKVMHEVSEVTASFPSRFTDHSSPVPETLIRAFEICLVAESFKSGRFGPGVSHPGLCDNKEGPAFLLTNHLKRSSCVIAQALIRLKGFILHISRYFSTTRKWQLIEMKLFEGDVSRTPSGWLTVTHLVGVKLFSSG